MPNLQTNTNQEIYRNALQEWRSILSKLWTAFGKPINPAQFKIYSDTLSDTPLGILEHVVDEAIRRHKYNSVPTLGEVQELIDDLHPDLLNGYIHTRPNRDARNKRRLLNNEPEYEVE